MWRACGPFKFGQVCGAMQAFAVAHFIKIKLVNPAHWKRVMGVTADKDSSRQRASQLFPRYAQLWSRRKNDGRAEAALIAIFGAMNP
jgi:crossover junction endodeoxyribonuclease RuvC